MRNNLTAGILAIMFGGFGVHKFYNGQIGLGIVYLLFFWTLIPGLLGLIEGICYLTEPAEKYNNKFNKY